MTPTPNPADLGELVAELRGLLNRVNEDGMYCLPWRVHDHSGMGEPEKWIGYAWIGADGEDDGRFDRVVADLNAQKDGSEKCRRTATLRASLIAKTLNALPTILEALADQQREIEGLRAAVSVGLDSRVLSEASVAVDRAEALEKERNAAREAVADWEADRNEWGRQVHAEIEHRLKAEAEVAALQEAMGKIRAGIRRMQEPPEPSAKEFEIALYAWAECIDALEQKAHPHA